MITDDRPPDQRDPEAWFRLNRRYNPEQLFWELIVDAGFHDFTVLSRAPNLRTETAGSDVIMFRARCRMEGPLRYGRGTPRVRSYRCHKALVIHGAVDDVSRRGSLTIRPSLKVRSWCDTPDSETPIRMARSRTRGERVPRTLRIRARVGSPSARNASTTTERGSFWTRYDTCLSHMRPFVRCVRSFSVPR